MLYMKMIYVCMVLSNRDSLSFASEPVIASLANFLRLDVVDQRTFSAKVSLSLSPSSQSLFAILAVQHCNTRCVSTVCPSNCPFSFANKKSQKLICECDA